MGVTGCYSKHVISTDLLTREFTRVTSPAPNTEGEEKEGQELKSSEAGHHCGAEALKLVIIVKFELLSWSSLSSWSSKADHH